MRYGSPWKASTGATNSARMIPIGRAMADRMIHSIWDAASGVPPRTSVIRTSEEPRHPVRRGCSGAFLMRSIVDGVLEQNHPQRREERQERAEQRDLWDDRFSWGADELHGGARCGHDRGSAQRQEEQREERFAQPRDRQQRAEQRPQTHDRGAPEEEHAGQRHDLSAGGGGEEHDRRGQGNELDGDHEQEVGG